MTTAIGWVRATPLPGLEGIRVAFGDLLEMDLAPEDVELLLCDLSAGLATLYARAGRWPDWVRLMGQLGAVTTMEPGLECQPE